jgi:capsular polysaccharide transport system permease protein
VVSALVLREIITRYGRHNIGFLWLFVEPMLFTIGIVLLWNTLHESHGKLLSITPFAITGYSTVLMWRNAVNRCVGLVEPNRALLFHRNVKIIDFFFARIILEIMGATASFIIVGGGAIVLGFMAMPKDFTLIVIGWLLLAWFVFGAALIIGSLSHITELIDRVWHVITYFYLPLSGMAYMVEWLPHKIQPYAMLIPTVNFCEMIRGGYFGSAVHPYYDIIYTIEFDLVLTFIGLMLVQYVSRNVEGA